VKLLFDENLSPRLGTILGDMFPGSLHVRDVGLKSASDPAVWEFAKKQGLTILSKDADFRQRSLLFGAPPKVIGLLTGNCSTTRLEQVIRDNADILKRFEQDPAAAFLELP
jgi:predicted nuclease of predicted toxin-antitoxin system